MKEKEAGEARACPEELRGEGDGKGINRAFGSGFARLGSRRQGCGPHLANGVLMIALRFSIVYTAATVLSALALISCRNLMAQAPSARATAPAIRQAPVDFNHPPREYAIHRIQGWQVYVELQLERESPKVARAALMRLDQKLHLALTSLPPAAVRGLRKLRLFMLYGTRAKAGGRVNGLEYYQAGAAAYQNWLDPRMEHSVVIYNAENYIKLSDLWAIKSLIHEFGHAQHLEHLPAQRADIYDAWDHAIKSGMYKTIRDEDKAAFSPNYAAQNHLEYFAELSAMYFVGANYYPHNRQELQQYDPMGYALIESLWGVKSSIHNGAAAADVLPDDWE